MKIPEAPVIDLEIGGRKRSFDLDDPVLPDWVEENAIVSDGFPYDSRLKRKTYEKELLNAQKEMVKVQYWLQESGARVIALFEGRDAAGKGGTIKRIRQHMNPRQVRTVALPKPSDTERGQWYFQRYVDHFPTTGEMVLFDRSWYNRAGVEPVMGFCTPDQHEQFLDEVVPFEQMITRDGIYFFKFWLTIGQEMQLKRFHARRHDPVKIWKLSPVDIKALGKWNEYTAARDRMFADTHAGKAPWTVIESNDKRRARINAIRVILDALPYDGKDAGMVGSIDPQIVGSPG